jgi:hypothetical protein
VEESWADGGLSGAKPVDNRLLVDSLKVLLFKEEKIYTKK